MHELADRIARIFALAGGAVLTALILLVSASVLGRSINSALNSDFMQSNFLALSDFVLASGVGPINGDFEIVQAGMAFVIFAFLPFCQLKGAHASVDLFTKPLSSRANSALQIVIDIVFAAILLIITKQLISGMFAKMQRSETTFLLEFPVWWGYALSCVPAIAASLIALYIAYCSIFSISVPTAESDIEP